MDRPLVSLGEVAAYKATRREMIVDEAIIQAMAVLWKHHRKAFRAALNAMGVFEREEVLDAMLCSVEYSAELAHEWWFASRDATLAVNETAALAAEAEAAAAAKAAAKAAAEAEAAEYW